MANFQRKIRQQYMPLSNQLCVPASWCLPIMVGYHDFLNHANAGRAYYSIRQRYFWKNQYAGDENSVEACEVCQQIQNRKRKPIELWKTPAVETFDVIHTDHFGELNVQASNTKHRYV